MESSYLLNSTCKALELLVNGEQTDLTQNESIYRCETILQETKVQILQLRVFDEMQDLNESLNNLSKQLELAEKKVKDLSNVTKYVEINSSGIACTEDVEKLILKVKECQGLLEVITTNAYHENAIREGKSLLPTGTENISDFVRVWCDSNLTFPGQFLLRESSSFPHTNKYLFFALSIRRDSLDLAHTLIVKDLKSGRWHQGSHQSNILKICAFSAEKLSDLLKPVFSNLKTKTPHPLSPLTPQQIQEFMAKKYLSTILKKD